MHIPDIISLDVPLRSYTTLNVGGNAEYFASVETLAELEEAVSFGKRESIPVSILGGGSNVLVADYGVAGLVIHPMFSEVTYRDLDDSVLVTAGAGVVFDDLVSDTVERGLWGLENLSAIPGTVGGVPIQNVGAYGVEAKDVVVSVGVFDRESESIMTLTNADCAFQYRSSFFKTEKGKQYIIVSVTFRLTKEPTPHIEYKDLKERFMDTAPTVQEIRDAVVEIRGGKFPDWHVLGTAGSFFKNPIVPATQYALLQEQYPELPGFKDNDGKIKIPLGWILDHVLNLRGMRGGNVGLYEKQALVLVNYGDATAEEIMQESQKIIDRIKKETGIFVEREVVYLS